MFTTDKQSQMSQKLTSVVYKVQTSPVASTAPHSSNPVTGMKKSVTYRCKTVTGKCGYLSHLHLEQRQEYKHKLPYRQPVKEEIIVRDLVKV